jgi:hypothetical protein
MEKGFKIYCKSCKRSHIMIMKPCPSCGGYQTPQPKSEKIYDNCMSFDYDCDGCEAYKDHYR